MLVLGAMLPVRAQEIPLCVATDDASSILGVTDDAGGAIFVWRDVRDFGEHPVRLYAQRVDATGAPQWTPDGVPVAAGTGDQVAAAVIPDGTGGVFVAWSDNRSLPLPPEVYLQRLSAAGTPAWGAGGLPAATTPTGGRQSRIALAPDDAGGLYVVWESDGGPSGTDLWAQRVSAAGVALWDPAGIPVCLASGDQILPSAVASIAGSFVVVWQDWRAGLFFAPDPYAQRVDSTGTSMWMPCGVPVTTSPGSEDALAIVSDAAGGVVVAWDDDRGGPRDLYAQRLDADGIALWDGPEPGPDRLVSGAPGDQIVPHVAGLASGEFVIGWVDDRGGSWDIYAQTLSPAGNPAWTPDGTVVTAAPLNQWLHGMVVDPGDQVLFLWHDERDPFGVSEIYGQTLDPVGSALGPPDGQLLVDAPLAQRHPVGVVTGPLSAVIAWEDGRSDVDWDLYARAIPLSPVSAPPAKDRPTTSIRIVPNPARDGVQIHLTLARAERTAITVHDVRGREVKRLFEGTLPAGTQSMSWDGRGNAGRPLPASVYFVRARGADGTELVSRMVLAR